MKAGLDRRSCGKALHTHDLLLCYRAKQCTRQRVVQGAEALELTKEACEHQKLVLQVDSKA